jgi:acetyl-CoA acetyltransferase
MGTNRMHDLKNRIAVAGVGTTKYGSFPETDEYGLGALALRNALDDCGLDKKALDGMLVCRIGDYERMGEIVGVSPRWSLCLPGHGRMAAIGIIEAMKALYLGQANYVALIYGNVGRSRQMVYGGGAFAGRWDPWGYSSPGAAHAMMFRRHMELYGTTTRQLAEVSVALRYHASMNPDAVMKKLITIEDHEKARRIVEPLGLLDYCLVNDGGVAIIMTSAERARDLRQPVVRIAGVGARDTFEHGSFPTFNPQFWYDELGAATSEALTMADAKLEDIDLLNAYDNFSPTIMFSLEAMGFCGRGESGSFVENGALKIGGRLPTNTDGGHLSNSYMQGWGLNVEAVRQVRGNCGERQVKNARLAAYAQATPCSRVLLYSGE